MAGTDPSHPSQYTATHTTQNQQLLYSLVTNYGATNKLAISGPIRCQKTYVLVVKTNATYSVFCGENSRHDYRVFMAIWSSQLTL